MSTLKLTVALAACGLAAANIVPGLKKEEVSDIDLDAEADAEIAEFDKLLSEINPEFAKYLNGEIDEMPEPHEDFKRAQEAFKDHPFRKEKLDDLGLDPKNPFHLLLRGLHPDSNHTKDEKRQAAKQMMQGLHKSVNDASGTTAKKRRAERAAKKANEPWSWSAIFTIIGCLALAGLLMKLLVMLCRDEYASAQMHKQGARTSRTHNPALCHSLTPKAKPLTCPRERPRRIQEGLDQHLGPPQVRRRKARCRVQMSRS